MAYWWLKFSIIIKKFASLPGLSPGVSTKFAYLVLNRVPGQKLDKLKSSCSLGMLNGFFREVWKAIPSTKCLWIAQQEQGLSE